MRVLALDTTTRIGSAALVRDGQVVAERAGDGSRSHAERLPAEIVDLMAREGLQVSDIDAFAVASGPGSFTGLRIGLATALGFGAVTGRPVVGVSALEALGHVGAQGCAPDDLIAAFMDARRHEVFAALYRVTSAALFAPERLLELEGPTVGEPGSTLERWSPWISQGARFVGDGVVEYAEAIRRVGGLWGEDPVPLLAGAVGRLGEARVQRGEAGAAFELRPLYVRRPDAVLDRERRG